MPAKAVEPEKSIGFAPLSKARIAQIAAMLPDAPRGFGPTCKADRAAWDTLRETPAGAAVIAAAEKLLDGPFPAWDDNLFLDFSRTGQRPPGEKMINSRHGMLVPLVTAECLENKGRFVPRIETALREYAAEPTWTLPAHDVDLSSFHQTAYNVDLGASTFGADLAQTLYLLDGILSADVRNLIFAKLEQRVFEPIRTSYSKLKGPWWMTGTNNWNAVCLAGVTAAALTVLPDKQDRAFFAAGAERYSQNSIIGFKDDGYCDEGLGYYNYGFGRYVMLREALWQATGGKLDLFTGPKIRKIATFGPRLEIENATWPTIADCRFGMKVDKNILWYCSRNLGLGIGGNGPVGTLPKDNLLSGCLYAFPNSATIAKTDFTPAEPVGLRSYFDSAGILVVRPVPGSGSRLGAALKGGHNDASHNHNDLGSFTIVLGSVSIVGDPGGPNFYNSKTFGPERYTAFKLYASYGHPVPLVGGKQQRPGHVASARVASSHFSDGLDTFALDITSAYPPGSIEKLVRTFHFDRSSAGSLAFEDEFAFPSGAPQTFESALTTHGEWKQTAPDTLTFTMDGETLVAKIETPAQASGFTVTSEVIQEDCIPFTRIGLRLNKPVASGKMVITFRPSKESAA